MLEGAIDARSFNTVRSSGKSLVIKSSSPEVLKGECGSMESRSLGWHQVHLGRCLMLFVYLCFNMYSNTFEMITLLLCQASGHWYRNIPPELACHFPQAVDIQEGDASKDSSLSTITMSKASLTVIYLRRCAQRSLHDQAKPCEVICLGSLPRKCFQPQAELMRLSPDSSAARRSLV